MKILFFIPVWNQIHELPKLLAEIKSLSLPCDQILLINNGSNDGSEEVIRTSGYPFVEVEQNRGVGYSFVVAIEWAKKNGFDVLGGLAGNGKMDPSHMSRLIDPLIKKNLDYVTGSRYLPGGESPNLPLFRRIAIPLVNFYVRCLTGQWVSDATCGYKVMRLSLFDRAEFDWRAPWLWGYSFEYYLFAKVVLSKQITWCEVPVAMRYPAGKVPYTKIKPLIGWYQMLRPWVIARFDGKRFRQNG